MLNYSNHNICESEYDWVSWKKRKREKKLNVIWRWILHDYVVLIIHPFSLPLLFSASWRGSLLQSQTLTNRPMGNLKKHPIHLTCMTELLQDTGAPRGNTWMRGACTFYTEVPVGPGCVQTQITLAVRIATVETCPPNVINTVET